MSVRGRSQRIGCAHGHGRFASPWVGVDGGHTPGSQRPRPRYGRQTHAARTDNEHVLARTELRAVYTVQPDRERFDQSRIGGGHFARQRECMPGRYDGKLGETAPIGSQPDVAGLCAVRYRAAGAVPTAAAGNDRQDSHIGAFPPAAGIRPDRDDLTAELMTHDHAGRHEGLRLDVRSAYTARRDPDHQLVGSWCRIWHFDDIEPVLFRRYRCLHCQTPSSSMLNVARYSAKMDSRSARVTPVPSSEYGATPKRSCGFRSSQSSMDRSVDAVSSLPAQS